MSPLPVHAAVPPRRRPAAAIALLAAMCFAPTLARAQYTEVEPNETKAHALANGAVVLTAGATLTGSSTGGSTGVGAASRDTWLVRTTPQPPGIYRHRLTLTSVPSHTVTLLGKLFNSLSEATAQPQSLTNPLRIVQWYGFGREEQVYVRVTGATNTAGAYQLVYSTQIVTPVDVSGSFAVGDIDISAQGLSSTIDSEVTVFDGDLVEMVDYQNDDPAGFAGSSLPCRLLRPYAAGVYYLAMCRWQAFSRWPETSFQPTANHVYGASRGGETSGPQMNVLDFPDAMCTWSNATSTFPFRITDSLGATSLQNVSHGPFEIVWYRITVGGGNCAAPAITSAPTDLELCFGNTATLAVTATGTAPLSYQWAFNNVPIAIGNGPSLTLPNVDFSFDGIYTCQVSNACGTVTSAPVHVHVHPAGPEITDDPDPQTLCVGATATFSVVANARMAGLLSYQWFHDGLPVPGADTATWSFVVGGLADGGNYFCRVTELGCGAADSSAAALTVRNAAPVITLLGDPVVTLECGIDSYVEAGAAVADDCDSGLTVTIAGAPAENHPEGHFVVTYDAVDTQGNHAVQVQRHVHIVDTIRPTVQVAVATPVLWSPQHELVGVGLSATTFDACAPEAAAANVAVQVFCDEIELPDTGDGTGRHAPDAKDIGVGTLRLRSERRGAENGRVYVIVVTTRDDAGNTGFGFATVVCPSSQSQAALAAVQQQANVVLAQLQAVAAATQRSEDVVQALALQGFVEHGSAPANGPHQ